MKGPRSSLPALVLAWVLAPVAASAATAWTTTFAGGSSVMGEISSISFTVNNTSTGGELLTSVTLQLNSSDYDVDGGLAPAGWQVANVDKNLKRITFAIEGATCPRGLAPGGSVTLTMRVIGAPANSDQTDALITTGNGNKTFATFACASGSPSINLASSPTWKRIGIGANLSISPASMPSGATVTVTLTVTNRSSGSATLTPVADPAIIDNLTGLPAVPTAFMLLSSPSPATLALGQDGTGVFVWTYRANNQGVFHFTASAHTSTNTLTSQVVSSLDLATGQFPGTISIYPDKIVSGGSVRVTLSVRNNFTTQVLSVAPSQPTLIGAVTAVQTSGPSPASVTSLPPGSATSFVYYYTITGAAGTSFQFTGQANAVRGGFPISSDPVGSAVGLIGTHTVSANPIAVTAGGTVSVSYTVLNGGAQDITEVRLLDPDGHFVAAATPWSADTTGWTAGSHSGKNRWWPLTSNAPPTSNLHSTPGANTKKFTFTFGSITSPGITTTYTHRFELLQSDNTTIRVEAPISIYVPRTVAPSTAFTAVATNGRVGLAWNNPLDHDGTVVLRSTAGIPDTAPVSGRLYSVGEVLGNASVVYADLLSYASTYGDTAVVNGTRYYYKVFNHDGYHLYASGDVPTSSGLFAIPSAPPSGPAWCYSVGLLTTQQPFTDFGVGVYTSSQAKAFTGNNISTDPTLDGTERWRPTATNGVTQSRPTVTPMYGRSGMYIVAGDQLGYTYAIDVATGLVVWNGNGGASIGAVQAQAAVQATQYTSTTTDAGIDFRTRYPNKDLVFFGTRTASTSTNRVFALSSVDGAQVWSINPGNLDIISGGMVVDYATNRLWVASRAGAGGTQPSLRVIDIINPAAPATTFNLGDIDDAVIRNAGLNEIEVVNNSGVAYGFDPVTLAQKWTYALGGAVAGYLVPVTGGFIASTPNGVRRYTVTVTSTADGGSSSVVTPMWSAATAITGPSAGRIDSSAAPYKLYVSDSTGKVNRLDLTTGALEASFTLSNLGLGMPSIDPTTTPKRLFVGGQDGRVCAINLPF